MSLVDVDSWLTEYEACERLSRDIQSQIVSRNREHRLSDNYSKISGHVRVHLKQFTTELEQLNKKLDFERQRRILTEDEAERRQRQIEYLQSKLIQLQQQFTQTGNSNLQANRTQLLKSSNLWGDDNDENNDDEPVLNNTADNYSVGDLRKQQSKILDDQNVGLEALSKVISRQKHLAVQIGEEVDLQNDIIDELADQMENTDSRVNSETRHVAIVDRKDKTCGYWVIIVSLLVAIIIVGII